MYIELLWEHTEDLSPNYVFLFSKGIKITAILAVISHGPRYQ